MKGKWVVMWNLMWTNHTQDEGKKIFDDFATAKKLHAKKSVKLRSATWSPRFGTESTRTTVTP